MRDKASRICARFAGAGFFLALVMGTVVPAQATTAEVPEEVRRSIKEALQKRVGSLIGEKNEDGKTYRRGIYSNSFQRVDDWTYQVTFHLDEVEKDALRTERYTLTLKSEPGKSKFQITEEKLEDTYRGLFRLVPSDETFGTFESLSFDREGMKISATNGSYFLDYRVGEIAWIVLQADDLTYDYMPPGEQDRAIWHVAQQRHKGDLLFNPLYVAVNCDPVTCKEFLADHVTGMVETDITGISAVLKRNYEDLWKEEVKDRKESPFSGFGRDWQEGHRRLALNIKRDRKPEKYVGLRIDNHQNKQVSFWATGLGNNMFAYHPEEIRNGNVDPLELERRSDPNARDFQVEGLRGTIELALKDPSSMTGDISYNMIAKRDLNEIPFLIFRQRAQGERRDAKNPSLRVNSIQDGTGRELTWVKTGPYSGLVVLPEEVPADSELTLRMQFENRDVIEKFTASHSIMTRGGWLPFVRFGDMIPAFDLTVKAPAKYTTLGIGKKVSEEVVDDVRITRWIASSPVSFPTVIFGDYESAVSKVKATKMDGTEIPVTVYVDRDTMGNASLLFGEDMGSSFAVLDAGRISPKMLGFIASEAANALNLYREMFGIDYPYAKLDLVNDPLGFLYGQAPSSIVYLGYGAFYGDGKLSNLSSRGRDVTQFTKGLVAHEVAHQWWGSAISNANQSNYWFVESLAEYSSAVFVENRFGQSSYDAHVASWRQEILDYEPLNGIQSNYTVWQGDGGFGPYRAAIYAKGPYAFHILRETVGDEKFFKFLKDLAQEFEGEEIVTRDIQMAMEKSLGGGMEWFFDQWIRGNGVPEFEVTYSTRQNEDGSYMIEGEIRQQVVLDKDAVIEGKYFQGVVPLTVDLGGKETARLPVVLKGEVTTFQFKVPKKPKKIVVLKNGEFLARVKVAKN